MQLKQLLTDERAVSPVIGVILMVAITVILAAVIGTFVLGLGDSVNSAPQASLGFNFTDAADDGYGGNADDKVNITHESGQNIQASTITVQGDTGGVTQDTCGDCSFPDQITVGDGARYINVNSNELIRVIWSAEGSDSQQVIARATAPT